MKARIETSLVALITLMAVQQIRAVTLYPIATNSGGANLGSYGAGNGTNIMVAFVNVNEAAFQLVSTNGTLVGGINDIGITAELPNVVYAGTNFTVLWYQYTGHDWRVGVYTTNGTLVATNELGSGQSNGLQVLQTDGTNVLAAWQTNGGAAYYGQFLTSAGGFSGPTFPIVAGASNLAGVYGASNYFFIWQITNASAEYNTIGAFVSKTGSVGTPFQINVTTSLDQSPPGVAFDGTNFLALWSGDTSRNASGAPNWNLYGRVVTPSGGFASGELLLNTNQPTFPFASFDGTNYLVSWSQNLTTTNANKQLVFQYYNRSVSPIGSEFTPFPVMGTNAPLFGGAKFVGPGYIALCTIGSDTVTTNGNITAYPSGAIYAAFLSIVTTLSGSHYAGGQFAGTLTGTPGLNYAIEYATNVTATNWTPLVTNSGTFNFTDTNATNMARFYRAEQQ